MKTVQWMIGSVIGSLLLVGLGCASEATKRDEEADISRYRTYRWIGGPEARFLRFDNPPIDYLAGSSRVITRPDIEPQLKGAVNRELNQHGFTETTGDPDFYVTYFGKAKDDDWISTWTGNTPSVSNVPLIMFPDYDRGSAHSYSEGSLLLVVYDANTRKPAWTGMLPDVLRGRQVNIQSIMADLSELVDDFKKSA